MQSIEPISFLLLSTIVLVACGLVVAWWIRRMRRLGRQQPAWLSRLNWKRTISSEQPPKRLFFSLHARRWPWTVFVELGLIGAWALAVGQPYLDPNPTIWPAGSEIGIQINTHYFWTEVQRCGACALWDGTLNGGAPALADPFGARLHPVVAITTLLFGVINGAKLGLVIFFWLAGVAQWWIARTLKLGWFPRLWSAGIAVVGGHLIARMQTGQFAMIASTASCSLALAAALHLGVTGQRRAAVVLGGLGGLAIISGHGYVQLSLASWAPAFLFILLDRNFHFKPVWREYGLALGLSLLIAAVFLVPMLHFASNYTKDSDFTFGFAQPLEYMPINLVVRDMAFNTTAILGKSGEPELHSMYIGWVPILLAALALRFARRKDAPVLLTLTTGIAISYLFASATALRWLASLSDFFLGFRHPSLMAVLAVPAILALAAYGLDGLLKLNWPQLILFRPLPSDGKLFTISLATVLLIPTIWSLTSLFEFSRYFIRNADETNIYGFYADIRDVMIRPDLKWVAPPYGEGNLVEPALHFGAKLTNVVFPSHWRDHEPPDPEIVISRQGDYPGAERITQLNDVPVYQFKDRAYAFVDTGGQTVRCRATGGSGDIDVDCTTDRAGQLIAQENSWNGWQVTIDQQPATLIPGRFLTVAAPAGQHHFEFRYRPWDVALGLCLSMSGIVLAVIAWFRSSPPKCAESAATIDQSPAQQVNQN